ncbi:MAG TPA: M43 family zinc metalloprotease, partial [Bacteroidia bacterium]|nr:M43 family zinc metalloprotease [Bacteroidia bacterium]
KKMKKLSLLSILFLATVVSLNAQQLTNWCGSDAVNNAAEKNNPDVARTRQQLEEFTRNFNPQNLQAKRNSAVPTYFIPVVVHVIHDCGPENISDAQVYDMIRVINEDFQKLNADTASIVPAFQGIAADCEIEFRLARLDPNGNCTNGIDRIKSIKTYDADDASKLNPWPSDEYLNIWTVSNFGTSHANAAAYAYYPGGAPSSGKDGIISLHNYVGSIGTSSLGNSRTITHEIGHWINLAHVWGSTNQAGVACGDDNVGDTPDTKGHSPGNCNLNDQTCTPGVIENVQNYMEYAYCPNMFTEGQKLRMLTALNSSIGGRDNLWSPANLIATGIDAPLAPCVPTAAFCVDTKFICEGGSLTFTSRSLNLDATGNSYLWTINGATSANPTSETTTFTFPTAGAYDVTLEVTNATGTNSFTAPAMVIVTPTVGSTAAPIVEGFESITVPGGEWAVVNGGGNAWQQTTVAAHLGTTSMRLQNFTGNTSFTTDDLITATYSTLNTTNVALNFWLAAALKSSTSADALKVYGSTNCGATWGLRKTLTQATLTTTGSNIPTNFTPTPAQWLQQNVALGSSYNNKATVRFKFEFNFVNANNVYIDDINLTGTVGLNEISIAPDAVSVYPNPAENIATVKLILEQKTNVQVSLIDVLGKVVYSRTDNDLEPNEYIFEIPLTGLTAGVYFIKLNSEKQQLSEKLVIK